MTADQFVDALRIIVHDSAIHRIEAQLRKPSGRAPAPAVSAVSHWYLSLDERGKESIRRIVSLSVHAAVFGMLNVLDGVVAIEPAGDIGQLTLNFSNQSGVVRLNEPGDEMLHDLYQSKVYDEVFGIGG